MNHVRTRRGFTLIELLVVIAIIAVLVALLLPAVQQAREAARRTTCRNNIRQLALALHNYQSSHRVFPFGVLGISGNPQDNYVLHTWMTMILPDVDQQPLYNSYNCNVRFDNPVNAMAVHTVVPVYVCPSVVVPVQDDRFAPSHYAGNAGTVPGNDDGVLFPLSKISFRDLTDGSSNTIAAGEITYEIGGWARGAINSGSGGGGGGRGRGCGLFEGGQGQTRLGRTAGRFCCGTVNEKAADLR